MKKYVKEFCKRGLMVSFGGPLILAIIYFILQKAGVTDTLSVDEVVLGIVSSSILAFIAAGISVVNQIDRLPKPMTGLIQMAVLYFDYLIVYLINGWLPLSKIFIFSVIFVTGFVAIWIGIFIGTSVKVKKLNTILEK